LSTCAPRLFDTDVGLLPGLCQRKATMAIVVCSTGGDKKNLVVKSRCRQGEQEFCHGEGGVHVLPRTCLIEHDTRLTVMLFSAGYCCYEVLAAGVEAEAFVTVSFVCRWSGGTRRTRSAAQQMSSLR
jgi:hypothetical protein